MIKNGNPMDLDEFIRQNKDNDVFTGDYYNNFLKKTGDSSYQKENAKIAEDIKNNNLSLQLVELNRQLSQMGLAAQVYPKTNGSGVIIGYDLLVYDPSNKSKVLDDKGKKIDKDGSHSFVKSFNVAFSDSVKYGHAGINSYVDLKDANKNEVQRLKANEAQMKIVNAKLQQMRGSMKKKNKVANSQDRLGSAKAAFNYANDKMKSVEMKMNTDLQDKDKGSYSTGSQQIDASLSERVNIAPLLEDMKFAYGIDESYNNKVMEVMALVSQAKDKAKAIQLLDKREAELKKAFKNPGKYADFKQMMLSLRDKNIIYDYANNSENAFGSEKASTLRRNDTPGDILLSPVMREQGRKNTHNIIGNAAKVAKLSKMFSRGVLASKIGEAKEVKYAANVVNGKDNQIAYDASVLAVEMTNAELAKQGFSNLAVGEGQTVISKGLGEVLDTSHHTMRQTFTAKDIEEAAEKLSKKYGKLKGKKKLNKGEVADFAELQNILDDNGAVKDVDALVTRMFRRFLKQSEMELFKTNPQSSDKENVNIFRDENGAYAVSGEGRVPMGSGRRLVSTNDNQRSATEVAQHGEFGKIKAYSQGKEAGNLADNNIQVIFGREALDSRKYGSRLKSDIISTLIDVRDKNELQNFFDKLKTDAGSKDAMQKKSAEFFNNILSPSYKDGKVYITDDQEKVNKYLEGATKEQLSYYLNYLDTLRDSFGGNRGFGKVYGLDEGGNLVRTSNTRTVWTNIGGDNNPAYGKYADKGAVDFHTGYDSMVRALSMAASSLSEAEKKKILGKNGENKNVYDTVKEISSQFNAPEQNQKELKLLQESNQEAVEAMKATLTNDVDVKNLDKNRYITVGKGDGFSIDLDKVKQEKWVDGEVVNKEETLTYAIDQQRKILADKANNERLEKITVLEKELSELEKKGDEATIAQKREQIENLKKGLVSPSDFQAVIDTQGNQFKDVIDYDGKKYGIAGNAIYLDKFNGYDGKKLRGYADRGYASTLNNTLVGALQSGDSDRIKKAAVDAIAEMSNSVNNKNGSDYERLVKTKASHSINGSTLGFNPNQILSQEEYESEIAKKAGERDNLRLLKSDIASFGIEVSEEVVRSLFNAKAADGSTAGNGKPKNLYSNDDLKTMLKGFGLTYVKKGQTQTIDEMSRKELINNLIKVLTVDSDDWSKAYKSGSLTMGLRGVAGRFPFMNGLDLDTVNKVFIGGDLQGKGIRVGMGLAKKQNADFDGDHEALKFLKLTLGQETLFDKSADIKQNIMRKLSWIAKAENGGDNASNKVFKDNFNKGVSDALIAQSAEIASRKNKGEVGVFSNYASQMRNMMKELGFDETGMKYGLDGENENAGSAIIIRTFFEAMEQDLISAKKIINRLSKEKGKEFEKLSEEEKKELALKEQSDILKEVENLHEQFREKKITFKELTKQLANMGIFDADDDQNISLKNRTTQAGLLAIESMKGGKDFLKKISGGKYREFAMYGKAAQEDVDFAKTFENKGGFAEWDKTKEAQALYGKFDKGNVKYDKQDLFNMLLSGEVGYEDYGAISQEIYEKSFGRLAEFAKERGVVGQDGTIDTLLRSASNKTHIPEKRDRANNPYYFGSFTQEQVAEIDGGAKGIENANDRISKAIAELGKSGGKVGKALSIFLEAITGFSDKITNVAEDNGLMSSTEGAKILKEKRFLTPVSTTSITRGFAPYAGVSTDPGLVDKILANKDKKYFGYSSKDQMRQFVGDGEDKATALKGSLYGAKTEYFSKLKDVASLKNWAWSNTEDLEKLYDANKDSLQKDSHPEVKALVAAREDYIKNKNKYFDFLKAVHGENGYNDEKFFLGKHGAEDYDDLLSAWDGQIQATDAFYSPENRAEINGRKAAILPEAGFIGVTGKSGKTSYVGRTDLASARKETYTMPSGEEKTVNVLDLVDLKTKVGQQLSAGDILQGIMNSFAARQDIAYAKEFEKEGGGGFEAWQNSPVFKALQKKMENDGQKNVNWKEYYEQLVHSDTAVSRILKTNPKTHKTELVSLDQAFESLGHKEIMAQVEKYANGQLPQEEAMKLLQSVVTQMADAGYNVEGASDPNLKYANSTQEQVAADYMRLMKEKNANLERKKTVNYLLKDASNEKTEAKVAELHKEADELEKKLKEIDKNIEIAKKTKADLSRYSTESGEEIDVDKEIKADRRQQRAIRQTEIGEEQDKAKTRLQSTLSQMIKIQGRINERETRSGAVGLRGISKQQKLAYDMANEKDQGEYDALANSLKGVNWEKSVGGADQLAEILEKASKEAGVADQQIAALQSDLNPSIWAQLTTSVKGWFSQLVRGQLVWKILGQVQQALKTVMEDAKKLDSVLVNLQIVTGDNRENTRSLISTYASLAQTMSSTTSEVASAANDWLRQGYSVSESIDLITASLQLSKLGMIDSGKATSYLTSMLKGFKLEASDATEVVDKLTKVDMTAATSAGDIAEALRQFATTAQLSGVDLDESIAMATTIMDVSQKDASSTGNAIKTMLSRYGNVKAGTYSGMNITGDQNETTESLNDIDKVLKKLGISLRTSNLEFRDFDDVLDDIAAKWETLDSVSKNAIATAMAGTRQRESFLVLMENYDKYKDFIEEAADAEGTAAEKYEAYEDSLEASQKKLAAAWEELASKTEIVDFFKKINEVMATLVKYLPDIGRVFIRMFSGKAAANALNILQKSGSLSLKGLGKFSSSLFDPTYGMNNRKTAGRTGRTGLIDSQIRKGTSPILTELKKLVRNTSKSPNKQASPVVPGTPGAPTGTPVDGKSNKAQVQGKGEMGKGVIERDLLKNNNLDYREKRKALVKSRYDDKIAKNNKEIDRLKKSRAASILSGQDHSKEDEQIRVNKEANKSLRKQRRHYKYSSDGFEKDEFVANNSEEATLSDGTRLSDIRKDSKGRYHAKGHKGVISKKDYEELTKQQAANDKAAEGQYKKYKQQQKNQKAVAAAAAGISGFMSADTRNKHKNQFTGEWETNETTNENAKGIMQANTGIATALGTYFGGEAGGAMAGAAADFLNNYVIGQLIPAVRDENLKNDRFEQADKKKKQVEEAKSSITNVVDLASKETLTADDYSSLVKAQDELKDFMTKSENVGIKDEFVAYANKFLAGQSEGNEYAAKSFDELTNLADMTDAQRKKTAYALKVAQTKQENLADNAKYEKELDSLNTNIEGDYLEVSGYNDRALKRTVTMTAAGAAAGGAIGGLAGGGAFSWAGALLGAAVGGMAGYATAKAANEIDREATLKAWNSQSRDEQIAALEEMKAQGKGDSAKLNAMISKLQSINDTIKKIRDKMDQQRVEEGILEMSVGKNTDGTDKTLLDLSQNALKDMGTDAIIEKMATYLQDRYGGMADGSSYFYTDENGNKQVTAAARKTILKGLKSNEDIYGAITGQNYRLSDILGMKDGQTKTEMLNNFANALHVSVDELQGLGTAFGNFTLGDLTASAEDLSSKFSDMQTAITNIASGTQSWATTLKSVAKTYPELLGYASDEYTLSLAMFQKMSDYKKLQTDAQMSDIMANETYFDTFSDKLKESLSGDEWDQFTQAQINSFNDLQQYVANNDTSFSEKLNEAAQAELKNIKLMSNEERQVLEKVVSIKNAQIDKEINNLTSQKEAMQNINSQREYENKLIEAKIRLENATKEKKRVWREGVGWVYEEDQAAISEAKDNLDSITNEKSVSAVTKQIDQLNADKDYLSSILSDQEEATQRAFLQAYSDANGVTSDNISSLGSSLEDTLKGNSEQANKKWDEWMKEYKKKEDSSKSTLKEQYDALQKAKEAMNNPNLSDADRARAQEAYNTALSNYQSTYNDGLSKGYWKASDFAEGGDMYDMFGGKNDATVAGAGGAGYKQAQPDQFLYQKDDSGNWNKFVYNPGKTDVLSSSDWNQFYDADGQTGADFYNATLGDSGSNHKLYVNKNSDDITGVSIYDAARENTTSTGFASWLEGNLYGPTLVRIGKSGQWTRFVGGLAYKLDAPERVSEDDVPKDVVEKGGSFKKGSTDISKGNKIPLLMNEEGSEAIVTPSGTITALPSHSGIVPADITSNLWNLGNYAPDLLSALQRQALLGMSVSGTAADGSADNSVNINTVQMTVDADGSFNVDSFVQQLRQVAALTRNNKHQ